MMSQLIRKSVPVLPLMALGAILASGCGHNAPANGAAAVAPPAEAQKQVDKSVQMIQNDPRIPPQQKTMLIGRLKGNIGPPGGAPPFSSHAGVH